MNPVLFLFYFCHWLLIYRKCPICRKVQKTLEQIKEYPPLGDRKQFILDFNLHFLSTWKLVIFTSKIWVKVMNEGDVEETSEVWSCHSYIFLTYWKMVKTYFTYIIKNIVGSDNVDFHPHSSCSLLYVTWANYSPFQSLSFPTYEMWTNQCAHFTGR